MEGGGFLLYVEATSFLADQTKSLVKNEHLYVFGTEIRTRNLVCECWDVFSRVSFFVNLWRIIKFLSFGFLVFE